jgi:hypothetical protein
MVGCSAGSSKIEPGISPAHDIALKWATLRETADQAGISRRYGGIHFAVPDLAGRTAGRIVADRVWAKAVRLWSGAEAEESGRRTQFQQGVGTADSPRPVANAFFFPVWFFRSLQAGPLKTS